MRYSEERFYNSFIESLSQHHVLPLTLIVNEQMCVSHIYGDSSDFLRYSHGKVVLEIGQIVISELSIPVSTGLRKAIKSNQPVMLTNIRIKGPNDNTRNLQVQVLPILNRSNLPTMYSILISEVHQQKDHHDISTNYNAELDAEQRIADLEQELQFNRENLQATVEELETSNEELQATNEELLASNEELQSTNEELQSVNEELYTVNAEFQSKIAELTVLNTDMDNLFNSTQTAALFLDEHGEIRRITPKLKELFPIIDGNVGRPIQHLSFDVGQSIDLHQIIKRVMFDNTTEEHEFLHQNDKWYLLRATPYIVSHSHNAGVVLIIIDINDLKHTQAQLLQQVEQETRRQAALIESSEDAYIQFNESGDIILWNHGAEQLYGWSKQEAQALRIGELLDQRDRHSFNKQLRQLTQGSNEEPIKIENYKLTKTGKSLHIISRIHCLKHIDKQAIFTSLERTQHTRKVQNPEHCARCMDGLLQVMSQNNGGIILFDHQDKILSCSSGAQQLFDKSAAQMIGQSVLSLFPAEQHDNINQLKQQQTPPSKPLHLHINGKQQATEQVLAVIESFGDNQFSLILRQP